LVLFSYFSPFLPVGLARSASVAGRRAQFLPLPPASARAPWHRPAPLADSATPAWS